MESKVILITGGSGLVGNRLSELLKELGYTIRHLSRHPKSNSKYKTFKWQPSKGEVDETAFEDVFGIIHLAGAGIADSRWSESRKKLIIESRVTSMKLLFEKLKMHPKPKVFISASAIGFYGNREANEVLTESNEAGEGFLSHCCQLWEAPVSNFDHLGIRTAIMRIGIVLSTKGGALQKMLPSYRVRIGTSFGDGQQIYSWIHLDDLCHTFIHVLERDTLKGVFNVTAPQPVSNKVFAKTIATAKNQKSIIFPVPTFALRLILGEMSKVVLEGSTVSSEKIRKTGFTFKFPDLEGALRDLFQRKI